MIIEIIKIITSIIAVIGALFGIIRLVRKTILRRKQERNLSLFFGNQQNVLEYRKNFIRTKAVDRPPDDEEDFMNTQHFANKVDLIDFFIKGIFKKRSRLIFLVLADAGMGKTTFLINLLYKYSNKLIGKKYSIRYIALGDPYADEYIEKYKDDSSPQKDGNKTILLLDAFDEDPKALSDYSQRFNYLVNKCRTFAFVIITSRTQFFPEESKEKFTDYVSLNDKNNSYLAVAKKYIAPFSDKDISLYIRKKYSFKFVVPYPYKSKRHFLNFNLIPKTVYVNPKRKKVEDICRKATNLVARPMLLDNIELILSYNGEINYENEIYEALIHSWIIRESKKQRNKQPDDEKFRIEMGKFIKQAALHCYRNFKSGKGLYIETDFLQKIAADKSIELDKMDLSARSLLNRNSKGRFKFSHKTVFEYLLADYDLHNPDPENDPIDFSYFDFGQIIRSKTAVLNIIKDNKHLYFAFRDAYFFKKLNNESADSILKISAIIAVDSEYDVVSYFRHLENLATVYLLDTKDSNELLSSNFSGSENIAFIDMDPKGKLTLHKGNGSTDDLKVNFEFIKARKDPYRKNEIDFFKIR